MELRIEQDLDPMSPRENCNLGTMVCFHKRYNFGDSHDYHPGDYAGWDDLQEAIEKEHDIAVILPIYMFDHSGTTLRTTPFSCPWDSGQVGFIFITKEKVRYEYSRKKMSRKLTSRIVTYLVNEVQEYNQYVNGDVWGFIIEDDNGEHLDSCWGFYGREFCEEQAKEAMECLSK